MIGFGSGNRYYLYSGAADMRKSYDGLSGLVRNRMGREPMSGDVYLFLNKRRNQIKMLVWDRSGYVLYGKRLERGTFEVPRCTGSTASGICLEWPDLTLVLEGISLKSARKRLRYRHGYHHGEKPKKNTGLSTKKQAGC